MYRADVKGTDLLAVPGEHTVGRAASGKTECDIRSHGSPTAAAPYRLTTAYSRPPRRRGGGYTYSHESTSGSSTTS